MAVSEILKVKVWGHLSLFEFFRKKLQKLGIVEIINLESESSPPGQDFSDKLQVIEYLLKTFSKYKPVKGQRIKLKKGEVEKLMKFNLESIYTQTRQAVSKMAELSSHKTSLTMELEELSVWSGIKISAVPHWRRTGVRFGKLPVGAFDVFVDKLPLLCEAVEVFRDSSYVYLVLVYHNEALPSVEDVLRGFPWEGVSFKFDCSPFERVQEVKKELSELEAEEKRVEKTLVELSKNIDQLIVLYDLYVNLQKQKEASDRMRATRRTFYLEGWIRREDVEKFKKEFSLPLLHFEFSPPAPGEIPPTSLSNPQPVRDFEMITSLYGLPKYGELDPTPHLAPFFALFFGFCLTDAAYGFILAVASWLLSLRLKGEIKKLLGILFWGGVFSFLLGALTGGWFGDLPDRMVKIGFLPGFFSAWKKLKEVILVIDPLKNLNVFLLVSLVMGYVQLTWGVLLNFYDKARRYGLKRAVLEPLPLLLFLLNGGLYVLSSVYFSTYSKFFLYGMLGSLVFMLIGGSIVNGVGMGLFGVYTGAVGIFGDLLSYIRLAALGLSTGVIAMTINTIALLLRGIPIIGPLLVVAVLIGGHIFNLAVNALGGFVHTSRLQFVEFFGKFYEGGGKPFEPFREEYRYIEEVES